MWIFFLPGLVRSAVGPALPPAWGPAFHALSFVARMQRFLLVVLGLLPALALATLPLQATLEELARGADHIFVGRIIGVDMVDRNGTQITDPEARTGPGMNTQIRLNIQIDEVVASKAKPVPARLWVPLDGAMHISLGQVRTDHSARRRLPSN